MKTLPTRAQATMTVKELKEFLSTYPDDMAVMSTWESVTSPIRAENAELMTFGDEIALVFDVENYG